MEAGEKSQSRNLLCTITWHALPESIENYFITICSRVFGAVSVCKEKRIQRNQRIIFFRKENRYRFNFAVGNCLSLLCTSFLLASELHYKV